MQLASTFSLFFSAAPQFFLDFSQQLLNFCLNFLSSFKNCSKIQLFFLTQTERDTDHVTRKIGRLYFNFKVKFPYLKPTAPFKNCIPVIVNQGIEISQWPSHNAYIARTYLQPHYGNGVFGNVYFAAGQH